MQKGFVGWPPMKHMHIQVLVVGDIIDHTARHASKKSPCIFLN